MAQGWSHGPVGAVVAAWPAVSLVASYELLVWLIRTSGAVVQEPAAEHCQDSALACLTVSRPNGQCDEQGPPRSPSAMPSSCTDGESSIGAPDGASAGEAGNEAAVAAYRLSMQVGNPLSERKLAQMFGAPPAAGARARITEAQQTPSPPHAAERCPVNT